MKKSAQGTFRLSVCDISLDKLPDSIIGLQGVPGRLRFLDSDAFLDELSLRVVEYVDTLPSEIPYAVVSYPWRDLQMPLDKTPPEGSFGVVGAEHADSISIDVLRTICMAARASKLSLVWIDRLCILQDNKEDKTWQIQHMYELYAKCRVCLVVPGGLVRLAELTDTTCWADRAWTLQEAVAPAGEQGERLKCVFGFTYRSFGEFIHERCEVPELNEKFKHFLQNSKHDPIEHVLVSRQSAMGPLWKIFHMIWGWAGAFKYHQPGLDPSEYHSLLPVRIVRETQANLLRRATSMRGTELWRAAYSRSSSRPVDMILSIMGLFNVELSVCDFSADDRVKATVRLLQEIMNRKGRPATWLYIAPELPPSPELSTLPVMPDTSESGRAYVKTNLEDGISVTACDAIREGWDHRGAPVGRIDDMGYFIFSARAAKVVPFGRFHGNKTDSQPRPSERQQRTVEVYNNEDVWAVEVGRYQEFNVDPVSGKVKGTKPRDPPPAGFTDLVLMLVESHGDGMYHRVGMERHIDDSRTIAWDWKMRELRVGGPGRGDRVRFGISPDGPIDSREAMKHFGPDLSCFHNENRDIYVFSELS